jgi:glycosyltransferase involved in cell wall biosynthesis
LASVRRQSEAALEIIMVLDGATEECREIAKGAARSDSRIVVLDLPKSPMGREVNADIAVRSATAPRIFYIDDDDLWRPDHVATLGPLLDNADVADSRVCSLDRGGALHLAPCRGCHPRVRELLAAGRLKALYDTHLAHRKDAYPKFSAWVRQDATGDLVWHFLKGFAENPAC